ncbi:lysylphosphatidylglycerol synthetase-like protein (DUF2156 family) [Deinococcus metalli]|uniref:Lysylphosphatidylglycerol synthetase-like protein (DUF2156 family) n=1 Tax=Deinococcus metalli TaxID=1141878 RepID=A0A7W8NPE7_9DEIO|nr:DUF2156 domain-containing protein [Deinococcus metalli]MBB5375680.1 lysylphosphatidylglycerol synthetase-like protein (DUF2156 family) [Deinococcus metalli]GHF37831.1 hypothetical protein GCM10017781_13210 [Deinococcus metalli]
MTPPTQPAVRRALEHHARYARNPSSLVAIDDRIELFETPGVTGSIPYRVVGRAWVAGEPLAPADALPDLLRAFLVQARRAGRTAILAPVGPAVRTVAVHLGLLAVHLGEASYLDPRHWAPRGNRYARLRNDMNRAARQGVRVREVHGPDAELRAALRTLARRWLAGRRAGTGLDWIFQLDPAQHPGLKRTFVATAPDGTLLAFVSASPLPGRRGWYLEDVVRDERSPRGTAASVVAHALQTFGAEGASSVTLGGVPLTGHAGRLHLRFLRPVVARWYHVDGLQHFKAQFGADDREDEWLIVPSVTALPLAAWAVLRLAVPGPLWPLAQPLWTPPGQTRRTLSPSPVS